MHCCGDRRPPAEGFGDGQGGAGEILSAWRRCFYRLAERFPLGEKEALALINGSPCATALIADAVIAMERRLALAEQVLALSAEAIKAPLEASRREFEELWNDPHETACAATAARAAGGRHGERRPYQAPVSFRILPRVLGQCRRASPQAPRSRRAQSAGRHRQPGLLAPDEAPSRLGRVYSNGGYHNGGPIRRSTISPRSCADLCAIADRHGSKLLDGRFSLLPDQLARAATAISAALELRAVGYAEQAKRAAQRTFLPGSEGGGFGQNERAPPTFLAWRGQEQAGHCLDAALAALAVASQAFYVTDRKVPAALRPLMQEVRAIVPPMQSRVP